MTRAVGDAPFDFDAVSIGVDLKYALDDVLAVDGDVDNVAANNSHSVCLVDNIVHQICCCWLVVWDFELLPPVQHEVVAGGNRLYDCSVVVVAVVEYAQVMAPVLGVNVPGADL